MGLFDAITLRIKVEKAPPKKQVTNWQGIEFIRNINGVWEGRLPHAGGHYTLSTKDWESVKLKGSIWTAARGNNWSMVEWSDHYNEVIRLNTLFPDAEIIRIEAGVNVWQPPPIGSLEYRGKEFRENPSNFGIELRASQNRYKFKIYDKQKQVAKQFNVDLGQPLSRYELGMQANNWKRFLKRSEVIKLIDLIDPEFIRAVCDVLIVKLTEFKPALEDLNELNDDQLSHYFIWGAARNRKELKRRMTPEKFKVGQRRYNRIKDRLENEGWERFMTTTSEIIEITGNEWFKPPIT